MKDGYTSLAAGILLQAKRDIEAFPKSKKGNVSAEYKKVLVDIKKFLKSDWCQSLYEFAGTDYRIYIFGMHELHKRQEERLEKIS